MKRDDDSKHERDDSGYSLAGAASRGQGLAVGAQALHAVGDPVAFAIVQSVIWQWQRVEFISGRHGGLLFQRGWNADFFGLGVGKDIQSPKHFLGFVADSFVFRWEGMLWIKRLAFLISSRSRRFCDLLVLIGVNAIIKV